MIQTPQCTADLNLANYKANKKQINTFWVEQGFAIIWQQYEGKKKSNKYAVNLSRYISAEWGGRLAMNEFGNYLAAFFFLKAVKGFK